MAARDEDHKTVACRDISSRPRMFLSVWKVCKSSSPNVDTKIHFIKNAVSQRQGIFWKSFIKIVQILLGLSIHLKADDTNRSSFVWHSECFFIAEIWETQPTFFNLFSTFFTFLESQYGAIHVMFRLTIGKLPPGKVKLSLSVKLTAVWHTLNT